MRIPVLGGWFTCILKGILSWVSFAWDKESSQSLGNSYELLELNPLSHPAFMSFR